MNRQNNGVAPHAKSESSPSPSYSENSDLISSIKNIDVNSPKISSSVKTKSLKKQTIISESDVYVIKNEYESGNEKAGPQNRSEVNSTDKVDCSSLNDQKYSIDAHSKHSSPQKHKQYQSISSDEQYGSQSPYSTRFDNNQKHIHSPIVGPADSTSATSPIKSEKNFSHPETIREFRRFERIKTVSQSSSSDPSSTTTSAKTDDSIEGNQF